jgi:hypothetical protein
MLDSSDASHPFDIAESCATRMTVEEHAMAICAAAGVEADGCKTAAIPGFPAFAPRTFSAYMRSTTPSYSFAPIGVRDLVDGMIAHRHERDTLDKCAAYFQGSCERPKPLPVASRQSAPPSADIPDVDQLLSPWLRVESAPPSADIPDVDQLLPPWLRVESNKRARGEDSRMQSCKRSQSA